MYTIGHRRAAHIQRFSDSSTRVNHVERMTMTDHAETSTQSNGNRPVVVVVITLIHALVRMLVMPGRLEVRVGNPKVDNVHEPREEDHNKQQLESDVALEGLEQPLTSNGEPFRREPHNVANDDLGHRQNNDPGDHLVDPVQDAPSADVDAGMLEADPVGPVGNVIEQLEAEDAQDEAEGTVDDWIGREWTNEQQCKIPPTPKYGCRLKSRNNHRHFT